MTETMLRSLFVITCLALPQIAAAQHALNDLRAEAGLPPVRLSPQLEVAAKAHALDMANNDFFSHQGSDGSDVAERARRAGFGWCAIAENIAKGHGSMGEVMGAWAGSEGHRRNMLQADVNRYGLVRGPGNIWVLVLGRDGC